MSWYRRFQDKVRGRDEVAAGSDNSPYHRQALKGQEIRLLAINSTKSTLCLRTTRHKLDNIIEYDAISYVWGKEDASVTIQCNDGFLQITPHAYEMLEHLRLYRPVPTRFLWIDAVCINQADANEKAVQIPLMHQIYSKAKSVVVWMGPAIPQTLAFMADFDRVRLVGRDWTAMKSQNLDPRMEGLKLPVDDDPFWGGLFHLLNNEWFRRLWYVLCLFHVIPDKLSFISIIYDPQQRNPSRATTSWLSFEKTNEKGEKPETPARSVLSKDLQTSYSRTIRLKY